MVTLTVRQDILIYTYGAMSFTWLYIELHILKHVLLLLHKNRYISVKLDDLADDITRCCLTSKFLFPHHTTFHTFQMLETATPKKKLCNVSLFYKARRIKE